MTNPKRNLSRAIVIRRPALTKQPSKAPRGTVLHTTARGVDKLREAIRAARARRKGGTQ